MSLKSLHTLVTGVFLMTVATTSVSVLAAALPGGAGSLTETYQDWAVACQSKDGTTACILRQSQTNKKTGQHVLTAEFQYDDKKKLHGGLLMPFGLSLNQGVVLKVDDTAAEPALAVATCLPAGCVTPISVNKKLLSKLKAGSVLSLRAKAYPTGQDVEFKISLKGFSSALNRVDELMK